MQHEKRLSPIDPDAAVALPASGAGARKELPREQKADDISLSGERLPQSEELGPSMRWWRRVNYQSAAEG